DDGIVRLPAGSDPRIHFPWDALNSNPRGDLAAASERALDEVDVLAGEETAPESQEPPGGDEALRDALAQACRESWYSQGRPPKPWEELREDSREDWRREVDHLLPLIRADRERQASEAAEGALRAACAEIRIEARWQTELQMRAETSPQVKLPDSVERLLALEEILTRRADAMRDVWAA